MPLKGPIRYTTFYNVDPDAWLREELPGLLDSQYAALRDATKMWINAEGKGSPSLMAWRLKEAIAANPRLVAAAPSVSDLVAAKAAEHQKTHGEPPSAAQKMTWGRELAGLTPDERLERMPAASLVPAVGGAPTTPKPAAFDATDPNALVRAFAADQEVTYRELLDEHGPTRALAMASAWHDQTGRRVHSEKPVATASASNKAKADAWAQTPEAQAMSPGERISEYRKRCDA